MSGKELKEKIKLLGMSMKEVAYLLDISEQNLQNKLSASDIKVSFLIDLSKKLNKDVSYFLYDPPNDQVKENNKQKCESCADKERIISALNKVISAQEITIESLNKVIEEKITETIIIKESESGKNVNEGKSRIG